MNDRPYTAAEIQAMRQAIRDKHLWGRYSGPSDWRNTASNYDEAAKAVAVEEELRTHMMAGHTAEDLIASDPKEPPHPNRLERRRIMQLLQEHGVGESWIGNSSGSDLRSVTHYGSWKDGRDRIDIRINKPEPTLATLYEDGKERQAWELRDDLPSDFVEAFERVDAQHKQLEHNA